MATTTTATTPRENVRYFELQIREIRAPAMEAVHSLAQAINSLEIALEQGELQGEAYSLVPAALSEAKRSMRELLLATGDLKPLLWDIQRRLGPEAVGEMSA